jgi:hypothetical protein
MPRFKDQVKQIMFKNKSPCSESYSKWFTTKQVIQIRRSQDETFKIQENLKVKKKKKVRSQVEEKKSRTKLEKDDSRKFKMLKKVPMKESSGKLKNIEKNR